MRIGRSQSILLVALVLFSWAAFASPAVTALRVSGQPEKTRVVLELTDKTTQSVFTLENPSRVVIDLPRALLTTKLPLVEGLVSAVRSAKRDNGDLRIVLDVSAVVTPAVSWLPAEQGVGHRLVIDLPTGKSAAVPVESVVTVPMTAQTSTTAPTVVVAQSVPASTSAATTSTPTQAVQTASKARDLIIAIDPGHGGEDPGAIGPTGVKEKNVTLAIALKLKERIDAEPGMRAILTRDTDMFIPLSERPNRARQRQADMFVSIHADSVDKSAPSGSSVYTLSSKRATSEAARYLADRENAADLIGGVSLVDKSNVLASVLLDLTQGASMSASMEAAGFVLDELDRIGNIHHQQVQQASFKVLTAPDIPSMLVETAFISNPVEEQRLANPEHQARIADALMGGIRDYFYANSPPGTRIAQLKLTRQARN
jgi:N-acetylmuramoyl-L-alanine amidase